MKVILIVYLNWVVCSNTITLPMPSNQNPHTENVQVELYQLFELEITNNKTYDDPFTNVELLIELTSPAGEKIFHYGFYNEDNNWKIRFSPDIQGRWLYKVWFTDFSKEITGAFNCVPTSKPGKVVLNENNPFWLGKGGEKKTLFRSLHVGDRFFASNWDDPFNESDGNLRTKFLDWVQENKYNMLSIASHYTNRNQEGRGRGWHTPKLWPPDPKEYQIMEVILNDMEKRDITVFPFAGFFGVHGTWPVDIQEQELYIKYVLARIGHYPNIILNVSGPEPLIFGNQTIMGTSMRFSEIKRLGKLIDSLDVHNHILTVHNETSATIYGDLFSDESWYSLSTFQGPKTLEPEQLYIGLNSNRHRYKPSYAHETLWSGNKYHPNYTDENLRKNLYAILFSGSILNFGDMDGDSSSGFSGTLDLADCNQSRHNLIQEIWDWFETIPFHQMKTRYDLIKGGFCLANEGVEYYIYKESKGSLTLFLDFPYQFNSQWINAQNTEDTRPGPIVNRTKTFNTPDDGDDWILHVFIPAVAD